VVEIHSLLHIYGAIGYLIDALANRMAMWFLAGLVWLVCDCSLVFLVPKAAQLAFVVFSNSSSER